MAEIIEVITKLSVEVGNNAPLQAQLDAFKKQAEAIEDLRKKKELLERQSAKDTDTERVKRAKKAIDDLNKSIDTQTKQLTKQVQQSPLIQNALTRELGIIEQLTDKINDLKQARERQTSVEATKGITAEIEVLKKELADLTSPEQNIIEQLFGDSFKDEAAGAVRGLLQGIGLGTGLSIIPGVVDALTGLITYELSLNQQSRDLLEVNEKLAGSFEALGDSILQVVEDQEKLDILRKSSFATSVDGLKRTEEAAKAAGVVNGEVAKAEQTNFEAAQKRRAAELSDAKQAEQAINTFREKVKDLQLIGGQDVEESILTRILPDKQRIQIAKDLFAEISKISLPEKEKEQFRLDLADAVKQRVSFRDVLLRVEREYGVKLEEQRQSVLDKEAEIEQARIEFVAKRNAAIFQLNKKLNQEISADNDKYLLDEIARREKTAQNIEESFNIQGAAAVRALNLELDAAEKAGTATAEVRAKFDIRFDNLVRDNEAKKLEAIRLFNEQQLHEQQKLNQELLSEELAHANQQLQLLTGVDLQQNLELRNNVADKELQVQRAANSAQYDEQVQSLNKRRAELEKQGLTETAEYQQLLDDLSRIYTIYQQKQQDEESAAQVKRINNIKQGYADIIAEVQRQTAQLNASVAKGFSEEQLAISGKGGGGFFGRDFKNRLATLRNIGVQERVNIEQNTQLRIAAQNRLEQANKAREGATTPEGIKAAQEQVDLAITELDRLDAAINASNTKINDSTRNITVAYVSAFADAFTQITQIAAQGYNTLNTYRLQDLDREIQAREQRVSAAIALTEKGNTQVLDIETKALRAAQIEQRKSAQQQQAVNSALQLSYALLAVAKAAAEGGGIASIATVAAAVGAIVSGYGLVRGLDRSSQLEGFKDGVVGYKGKGTGTSDSNLVRISAGESIMTEAATRRNKPLLEAMNKGYSLAPANYMGSHGTRSDIDGLRSEMRAVREAVEGQKLSVRNTIDERGVALITERQMRKDRVKWKS